MRDYSMFHSMGGFWAGAPPGTCGIIEVSPPGRAAIEIQYDAE
jgi:hypothetical protein